MSGKTGKIPPTRRKKQAVNQSSSQDQDRALIARVIECMPRLNHDDTQALLGDSKLPGRVKDALTPWPKSDKFSSSPRDCIPSLDIQFDLFRKITSRLPNGLDFLSRKIRYGSAEQEIKDHKKWGPQLLLCDDLGDPVQTAQFLLEYIKEKWVEMDPERHQVEQDAKLCFVGEEPTVRLRTGDEAEQVEGRSITKESRKHFDHPYVFMLTDHAPLRASNMIPVINYRHIADMYDYMRLGVCEPLWFLAYFPEYLYWSGKKPLAFPGLDLGDLSVRGFSQYFNMITDRNHGIWREAKLDGSGVSMMNGALKCIEEHAREFRKSGKADQLVSDLITPPGSREPKDYEILTRDELSEKYVREFNDGFPTAIQEQTSPPPPPVWQRAPLIYVMENTLYIISCGISGRFTDIPSSTMMGEICAGM